MIPGKKITPPLDTGSADKKGTSPSTADYSARAHLNYENHYYFSTDKLILQGGG